MANEDRDKIQKVIDKTEDLFEGKLTYISAGALVLTLTFIEKIIPLQDSVAVIFLVIGWGLLVLTLLLNLFSHLISKYLLNKTILELDKNSDPDYLRLMYLKVIKRNKKIDCINWITVALLMLGISSIVIFVSANSLRKAHKQNLKDQLEKNKKQSHDSTFNNFQQNNYFYYGK